MSGIALFVPNEQMYKISLEEVGSFENNVNIIRKIKTEDAVSHAVDVISENTNIIIARGRQAIEIKKHTDATVIDITVTAQELALIIVDFINKSKIEMPKIVVFSWGDMLCDTTHFNKLFNIDLKHIILDDSIDWRSQIKANLDKETNCVIGGNDALEFAKELGVHHAHLDITKESIRLAINEAESIYNIYKKNKYDYAQFNSVLASAFNGITKIDKHGNILVLNHVMEEIVEKEEAKLVGLHFTKIFDKLDSFEVNKVLEGELENYSTFIKIKNREAVINIEPILYNEEIYEAIISCNFLQNPDYKEKVTVQKQFLRGNSARISFEDIDKNLKDLIKIVDKAKIYSTSTSPILIEAVSGPELEMITQGIHNYSTRKNAPFIVINLAGMTELQQAKTLFGSYENNEDIIGALEKTKNGTLVIESIDKLTLQNQYKLITCMRSKYLEKQNANNDVILVDPKIIATTGKNLRELRELFLFRSDLYFTLKSLRLRIPKLRERKEDVAFLLDNYIHKYMNQYSKYHILTSGAKRVLLEYPWEGNSIQLNAFCERLILTTDRRSITEEYVRDLLVELYHTDESIYNSEETDVEEYASFDEAEDIDHYYDMLIKTLAKYKGNRTLTANELKISTTTLWRKIKKYDLQDKY